MKFHRATVLIALLLLPLLAIQSQAADIRVFSSTALKAVLEVLGPQFEKETGKKLVLTIGPAGVMKSQIVAVPADFQSYLVLSGAISADSKNADAAKAFIKFITAPSVVAVLKAKGMEPGTP